MFAISGDERTIKSVPKLAQSLSVKLERVKIIPPFLSYKSSTSDEVHTRVSYDFMFLIRSSKAESAIFNDLFTFPAL